ncbi:MAG: hypothetical protein AAGF12_23435 [Myxococcota bacterium]
MKSFASIEVDRLSVMTAEGSVFRRGSRQLATGLFLLALGLGGCGNPEPLANWKTYEAPNGYRIRFLAPPWDFLGDDGGTAVFEVASNAEAFDPDAAIIVPPKYRLEIRQVGGNPETLAQQGAQQAGDLLTAGPRSIETTAGVEGFEFATEDVRRFGLVAFFPHRGRVLRLEYAANLDLGEDREVRVMIQSLEVE